jgi:hypothetical protein
MGMSIAAGREFYRRNHWETSPEMPDLQESSGICQLILGDRHLFARRGGLLQV